MQGQGRPHRLARIFTRGKPSSDNGRRLLGEAWRRPGEEPEEPDSPQTDVLAGFVLARAAAGLSDGTIASDVVMRPAGVPCRLSPGRAGRRGWTEGSHRRARSTQPGGY